MSKSLAYKHLTRALSKWPKDTLRPECQLQNVMQQRIDKIYSDASSKSSSESSDMAQANLLYSLVEDRYLKRYPIKGTLMTPASKPTHYTDLIRDIEEAPGRNWIQSTMNKFKGLLRFQ
ncbi:hypothetical protein BJ878DRAFT_498151 [Calycina marina]|uniref:Ubiquinol-cytochrome-c reductase complex assembly factor 2 n=1 Tax=Calycina marina TaxID=1763456 RepID=A0A9P8CGF6_9HELO|nr:hypothetical protein BJ878DRAFT_498151 [Calycina marina]